MNQELVHRLFAYNDSTGEMFHRFDHGRARCGQLVGWVDNNGYRRTKYKGVTYVLSRLAFLYIYGYIPEEVDHWDGNPGNDSITNLRDVSRTQNQANKKCAIGISGARGVTRCSQSSKWQAVISLGGQHYFLGNYTTVEEAAAAYRKAADELYGEYAYHNRPQIAA